jgi:pyruvate/2-oxoglutarate dehydrogenase complex dihydrolipoamide acyltransferase (E2) component
LNLSLWEAYNILAAPGNEIRQAVIGMIAETGENLKNNTPAAPLTDTGLSPVPTSQDLSAEGAITIEIDQAHDYNDLPNERRNRIFATPRARHLVQQHGIRLDALRGTGSGPHQWIIARDVQAYLDQKENKVRATPLAARIAEAAGIDLEALLPKNLEHPSQKPM